MYKRQAYGSLTVRAGETTRTIPVYVTSDPLVLLDGFEGEQTVLTQNTDKSFVRFGAASARWDYRAENVPENAEELLLSVERTYAVPSGYDRVTLWVYGDGQRETLALTTDAGETNAAVIDFTGWQQLTFTLPDKAADVYKRQGYGKMGGEVIPCAHLGFTSTFRSARRSAFTATSTPCRAPRDRWTLTSPR